MTALYDLQVIENATGVEWVAICKATPEKCTIFTLEGSEDDAREVIERHLAAEHPPAAEAFDEFFPPTKTRPLKPRPVATLPRTPTPRLPTTPPALPLGHYIDLPTSDAPNRWRAHCMTDHCRWQVVVRSMTAQIAAAKTHAKEHGWEDQ